MRLGSVSWRGQVVTVVAMLSVQSVWAPTPGDRKSLQEAKDKCEVFLLALLLVLVVCTVDVSLLSHAACTDIDVRGPLSAENIVVDVHNNK